MTNIRSINRKKIPRLTRDQEYEIRKLINEWAYDWKHRIFVNDSINDHSVNPLNYFINQFGLAKENLKEILCPILTHEDNDGA
jgi:hypothetical protein